jgi:putative IMPACT (imprinted ancient) family translation regulator
MWGLLDVSLKSVTLVLKFLFRSYQNTVKSGVKGALNNFLTIQNNIENFNTVACDLEHLYKLLYISCKANRQNIFG